MLPRARTFPRRKSSDNIHHKEHEILHVPEFLDDHLPDEFFRQNVIEIIRKLRIPGWSAVTENMAPDLDLDRINCALTNSVYYVKAPRYVKEMVKRDLSHQKLPVNLLLRIYGPNVDMLIDRDRELKTISELTKRNIGPKLFGTFQNGRFEQFFNAKSLNRHDMRNPETSKQIAKRMSDLHQNVPISDEDRERGPVVWQYLAKWLPAAREQLRKLDAETPGTTRRVIQRDSLEDFEQALNWYTKHITAKYPIDKDAKKDDVNRLVFCHNDTQYGNLLRLEPPKGSPLLQPQHEHRQLVVIDYEFSGPNPRALDISNHFCEWMYDYGHPTLSYHIFLDWFPSLEEQRRFITSYVEQGISMFDEQRMEAQVEELLKQAADYRVVVSAFWALWGIVQQPLKSDSELREELLEKHPEYGLSASPEKPLDIVETENEDTFDYLQYSREKMSLFWSDLEKMQAASKA